MSRLIFIGILLLFGCHSIDCTQLSSIFNNYDDAETRISNSKWELKDYVDCSTSSWIASASYYSCDKNTGYFLMKTKAGKSYLHQSVPKVLFDQFKNADSYGSFYNDKFRGNFQLSLK